jgi:Flp pilus assembly protein TadB
VLDPTATALAVSAGGCSSLAALALLAPARPRSARAWLARRSRPASDQKAGPRLPAFPAYRAYAGFRRRIAIRLEQAGRRETPELALGIALLASLASATAVAIAELLAGATLQAPLVGAAAGAATLGLLSHRLTATAAERRRQLLGQLGPILELVSLELSAGSPPMLALESVIGRSRSELAAAMRAQLIGSRVAGSASFDGRLALLADRLELPELHSMAMILRLSRDYGSGVGQGIRALAADLRRARRRRVIEVSRGALNRVLIPAAVGVLLPFMAILLFPAVAVLMRSLS